jgi:uncharacterized membrane protein
MKETQFKAYKLIIVILLGAIIGSFVVEGNYVVPLIAFLAAAVITLLIRSRVSEVQTDERILIIGGKAARLTLSIFTVLMAIASILLLALGKKESSLMQAGTLFAYTACGMLLLYSALFKFYEAKGG